MEPSFNDKVQNFLLGITSSAENFSMCEPSAVYTPSELSFCVKNSAPVTFKREPFIANLQEWLNAREDVSNSGLVGQEAQTGVANDALLFLEQLSKKVDSSVVNKEDIRHHLSAPIASSALPLHHNYQRTFMSLMESLQHLASKQDEGVALTSRKILQTVHQQIETAVEIEKQNVELQQTLLNMAADSELIRQKKLAH